MIKIKELDDREITNIRDRFQGSVGSEDIKTLARLFGKLEQLATEDPDMAAFRLRMLGKAFYDVTADSQSAFEQWRELGTAEAA